MKADEAFSGNQIGKSGSVLNMSIVISMKKQDGNEVRGCAAKK